MRLSAVACTFLSTLLLTACQPPPRPFSPPPEDRHGELLEQSDHGGVVVLAVAGVPDTLSQSLAAAMAKALRDSDVPAATSGGNSRSRFLQGWASARRTAGGRVGIELVWDLFDGNGRIIGSRPVRRDVPAYRWEGGDRSLMSELADDAADAITAMIRQPTAESAAAATDPALHVGAVTGATGDGGTALRKAMRRALRNAGFRLSDSAESGGLVIAGRVDVTPAGANRQTVEIVWSVRRAGGTALGKLTQKNTVGAGALDGSWGDIARIIANSAVGGLGDLLNRAAPHSP